LKLLIILWSQVQVLVGPPLRKPLFEWIFSCLLAANATI
jgi:hypothetical protein